MGVVRTGGNVRYGKTWGSEKKRKVARSEEKAQPEEQLADRDAARAGRSKSRQRPRGRREKTLPESTPTTPAQGLAVLGNEKNVLEFGGTSGTPLKGAQGRGRGESAGVCRRTGGRSTWGSTSSSGPGECGNCREG